MSIRTLRAAAAAAFLLAVASTASQASLLTFTDRAAFEAALSSFTVEDFEGISPISLATNLGTPVTFGAVTISNPGNVWATNEFGAPSQQVGDQNAQPTTLTLASGFNAIGMDLGLLFNAGSINTTVQDGAGNTLFSGALAVAENDNLGLAGTTFHGFVNTAGDLGTLIFAEGGFPTFDNLTVGTASGVVATPAPGPVALLALGLLALARLRRS